MNHADYNQSTAPELEVLQGGLSEKKILGGNNEEVLEIDLIELAFVLLDKLHYIVLFFLAGALVLNAYAYFFIHPTYQSTASLYVVSASGGSVVDLTDLNIGNTLKSDYEELIMSYPVLDRVSEKLNLGYSTGKMHSMITITNPNNTRILKLTATAESPELAMDIANTLAEVAVEYLPDTMSTDAPNIAQRARLASGKSGPSLTRYTLMGGLLGAVICSAIIILLYMLDDTIRTAEDMEKYFGAPPLATIPYTKELDSRNSAFKKKRENDSKKKKKKTDTAKKSSTSTASKEGVRRTSASSVRNVTSSSDDVRVRHVNRPSGR